MEMCLLVVGRSHIMSSEIIRRKQAHRHCHHGPYEGFQSLEILNVLIIGYVIVGTLQF